MMKLREVSDADSMFAFTPATDTVALLPFRLLRVAVTTEPMPTSEALRLKLACLVQAEIGIRIKKQLINVFQLDKVIVYLHK